MFIPYSWHSVRNVILDPVFSPVLAMMLTLMLMMLTASISIVHCAGNGPWRADKDDPSNLWSHYNPLLKQNEGIKTGNNDCKESILAK